MTEPDPCTCAADVALAVLAEFRKLAERLEAVEKRNAEADAKDAADAERWALSLQKAVDRTAAQVARQRETNAQIDAAVRRMARGVDFRWNGQELT